MSRSQLKQLVFDKCQNYKILIIDDDEVICNILERLFLEAGVQVQALSDSVQAHSLLQNQEFDVVLTDIYMPNVTGLDLLSQIHEANPQTPVIIMTGQPTLEMSVESLRLGAFDFLMKPFTSETVFLTMERALKYRTVLLENRNYQNHLEELVEQRTKELQDFLLHSVKSLTKALEAKDPYTQGHGYNVSCLVIELAKHLGIPGDHFLDLKLAAELHDIGKIGIPDSILLKPDSLAPDEYERMKEHVSIGYQILSPIPSLKNVSRYVHEHHERIDGNGYPRGLKNGEIHYNSQLLVVAEVCDALAAERCYKPPWPKEKIIGYFEDHAGKAFHPDVVQAMNAILKDKGEEILRMLKSSGV